jgi:hypothetical protein
MNALKKVWIDPPSGWKYGFPKVYDPVENADLNVWLVSQGYPQSEIDACGECFFMRQWEYNDE